MIGSIIDYITTPKDNFQPMNANFGIIPPLEERYKDKLQRYEQYSKRALKELSEYKLSVLSR